MTFRRNWPLYLGVFLVSASTTMLEISLTRVFSVSLWYQFGFMIISTALLGFGASGTYIAVKKGALTGDLRKKLASSAALYSISILVAFALMTRIPLDPLKPVSPGVANPAAATVELIGWMALYYAIIVVPFFFAGLTIGTALSAWAKEIGSLYFADLVGAGLGALGVVLALYTLPGQGAVVLCSIGAALGALVFSLTPLRALTTPGAAPQAGTGRETAPARRSLVPWALGLYLVLLAVVILPNAASAFRLYIPPSKPLSIAYDKAKYPDMQLEYTGWTPFSRIDVMWQPGMKGQAWGLSGAYKGELPEQRFLAIDAAAMTAINQWDGDKAKLGWVNALPSSLVYRITQNPNVLLIGPGGGVDVLVAYANEAKKVTAAEINPLIVDLMRNKYRQYSGGLYADIPQIDVQVAEGRNFVARSKDTYDLIQFSQVDTWAAAAAGAYSLTENYLYTLDAYKEYLSHLSPDGLLAIGRWHFEPPGQALRLVTIGTEALKGLGVADPSQHFIIVRAGDTANMFMKKSPFTADEIAKIRGAADPLFFTILYAPDMVNQEGNHFADFFRATDKKAFYARYPLDVSPTTDDRPFFFEYYGWTNFGTFRSGKLTLTILLIQAALLSLALILWPLWRFRKGKVSMAGSRRFIIYFAALGIGFIFIEVSLMQRFILFLGHPTFALSVVLFSLLTFSGIGSFLSNKLAPPGTDTRRVLRFVIPALAVLVVVYALVLQPLFHALLGWDIVPRILLSIIFIAPLGLLMGMPFPLGMRLVAATNEPLVPWAWGVNGCASVLGSIMSVMLAQSWGFTVVLGIALVVYLAGLAALLTLRTAAQPAAAASPA